MAAPHTWPASIYPVLLAAVLALACGHTLSLTLLFTLLLIAVLMQSAVNTFNDYQDYVKGADSKSDDVDPSDAVLVYNDVDPRSALRLAVGFMVAAFALGIYCIASAGWVPLAIAAIGAFVVFLYSGGKTPISYLPLGELASGFVMGALIAMGSWVVLTRSIEWMVLVWSLPLVIAIGLIMMTNNGCDIEKDKLSGRRTLPVLLGYERTLKVYHGAVIAWYVAYGCIVCIWFTPGAVAIPFAVLATYPLVKALFANPLTGNTRIQAMSQMLSLNIAWGAFLCLSILASGMAVSF